jgi:competence protein ComEC
MNIKPSYYVGGLIMGLIISVYLISQLPFGNFQFFFLDIGQGDAMYMRTPDDYHIIIDSGPNGKIIEELAEVLPLYNRTIDLIAISHPHADHINGFVEVLKRYEVKKILLVGTPSYNPYYVKLLELAENFEIPFLIATADKDFKVGEYVYLDIVWPIEPMAGKEFENKNNASLSMRVITNNKTFLLTGDAEVEEEKEIIESGFDLTADIFKSGHHGSRTASTAEFLDAVNPETVVIQSGEGNDFGHPHKETLKKYLERGMKVSRNDLSGRIDFIFSQF